MTVYRCHLHAWTATLQSWSPLKSIRWFWTWRASASQVLFRAKMENLKCRSCRAGMRSVSLRSSENWLNFKRSNEWKFLHEWLDIEDHFVCKFHDLNAIFCGKLHDLTGLQAWCCQRMRTCRSCSAILSKKSFEVKLSGNEVHYTARSVLGIVEHSCTNLHRQNVSDWKSVPTRSSRSALPPDIRARSNHLFQVLDLYRHFAIRRLVVQIKVNQNTFF